jgi:hypothetical protein
MLPAPVRSKMQFPREACVSAREHRRQWNGRIFFSWIVIIAAACPVYTVGITHESIWYDEAYSAAMAGRPPGEIIALTVYDNHPPQGFLARSYFHYERCAGIFLQPFAYKEFYPLLVCAGLFLLLVSLGIGLLPAK